MQKDFPCPVCTADAWQSVSTYTYHAHEHQKGGQFYKNKQIKLRREVLFEIFCPAQKQIELISQYCKKCGFVTYTPRPDGKDIEAKYTYLSQQTRPDLNTPNEQKGHSFCKGQMIDGYLLKISKKSRMERARAIRIFNTIVKAMPYHGGTILDVGGGDGKMLWPFQQAGFQCFIIDYNPFTLPGIKRLGASFTDIPKDKKFDILICSHVLEHVADPVKFLSQLATFLNNNGRAYIEVPMQIWKGIPIRIDPVTHINFFHELSLYNILTIAGFHIISLKSIYGSYGASRKFVIWAIVEKSSAYSLKLLEGAKTTSNLFYPPFSQRLKRELMKIFPKIMTRS